MRGTVLVILVGVATLLIGSIAQAECKADSDCKAGRVCVAGECTSPPTSAPSSTPTPAPPPLDTTGAPPVAPAPATAPPPAALGCAKDADCKGDRVCEAGQCVMQKPRRDRSERYAEESEEAPPHRSFGLSVLVGPWFPGTYNVEHVGDLDTTTGFVVRGALDGYIVSRFCMGAYVLYAHNSLDKVDSSSASIVALGGTFKGVFGKIDGFQFRPGFAFAYQKMEASSGSHDVSGINGLGLAFIGEGAIPFSSTVNGLIQLSFISQPVGGNEDYKVTFAPMVYLGFGIEYAN